MNYRQSGFSLLEVLVAFFILSLSLGTLYSLFGNSLRQAAIASEYRQAIIIAESKLAEARAKNDIESAAGSGKIDSFSWQVQVSPYEIESNIFQAYRIDVSIRWRSGIKDRQYQISSLALGRK